MSTQLHFKLVISRNFMRFFLKIATVAGKENKEQPIYMIYLKPFQLFTLYIYVLAVRPETHLCKVYQKTNHK